MHTLYGIFNEFTDSNVLISWNTDVLVPVPKLNTFAPLNESVDATAGSIFNAFSAIGLLTGTGTRIFDTVKKFIG